MPEAIALDEAVALEESLAGLDRVLARVMLVQAAVRRLGGDLELTESRLGFMRTSVEEAIGDCERALASLRAGR